MSASETKCKKKSLTLIAKKRILEEIDSITVDNSMSPTKISKKLNIARSTLLTILKNSESIKVNANNDEVRFRAPNKKDNPSKGIGKYDGLEKRLAMWISEKGGRKCVSNKNVRIKAKEISVEMGIENFTASSGWMDRFKKRHLKNEDKVLCQHEPIQLVPGRAQDFLNCLTTLQNQHTDLSGHKKNKYWEIEKNLMIWQDMAENEGVTVTGELLRDMSLSLAAALGVEYFSGSVGWLNKYKKKRAPSLCSVCMKRIKFE